MADNFFKIKKGIQIQPVAGSTVTVEGEIAYNDTSNKLEVYNDAGADPLVSEAKAATLTNKTIDADSNTITNIENADIKAAAGIAVNKLAATTVSRALVSDGSGFIAAATTTATEIGYVNGVTSAIQTQIDTKASSSSLTTHESDTSTHGVGVIVGTTETQTLTGKDIDGGTASNTNRITIPKASYSTLSGLTRKEATLVYASDQNKLYHDDGAALNVVGSGTGSVVNYAEGDNSDFENSVGSWTAFASTAVPTTLTGGSPTLTATLETSAPLRDLGSLLLTDGTQYDGASLLYTQDAADIASIQEVVFDFKRSTVGAEGDFEVWIEDVTNTTIIQPVPYKIPAGTGADKFRCEWQSSATGTSYRVGIRQAVGTSGNLLVDNFRVGPVAAEAANGGKAPTIQTFTSGTGTYTTPIGVKYIRVRMVGGGGGGAGISNGSNVAGSSGGNSTFGTSLLTANGGSGASAAEGGAGGSYTINSPAIGTGKAGQRGSSGNYSNGTNEAPLGGVGGSSMYGGGGANSTNLSGYAGLTNTGSGGGGASNGTITSAYVYAGGGGGAGGGVDALIPNPLGTYSYAVGTVGAKGTGTVTSGGDGALGYIEVTEYYSGGAEAGSTSIVTARASSADTSVSITVSGVTPIFLVEDFDTSGSFNLSTSEFTAPVSGYYRVAGYALSAASNWTAEGEGFTYRIFKKPVGGAYAEYAVLGGRKVESSGPVGLRLEAGGSTLVRMNAGDMIKPSLSSDISGTLPSGAPNAWFEVELKQGPSQATASDAVNGKYKTSATTAKSNSIDFNTTVYQSHGIRSGGGGSALSMTIPVSGLYEFNGAFSTGTTTSVSGNYAAIRLKVDSSFVDYMGVITASASNIPANITAHAEVKLLAGQVVQIYLESNMSAIQLNGDADSNWITIKKVGNY
jgi:hypothetical protein